MERKAMAAAVLGLFLAAALVPAASDCASAETGTARISNISVCYCDILYDSALTHPSDEMFFRQSSEEKLSQMDRILGGDHKGTVPEEDTGFYGGEPIRVYYISEDFFFFVPLKYSDDRGEKQVMPDRIYQPWGADFLVKAGDKFSFCVTEAVDNNGNEICCYVDRPDDLHYYDYGSGEWISKTYRGTMKRTGEFTFKTESYGKDPMIYVDITYEESGFSMPEGSSLLYAALFASVTAIIFAVLAYAGLRPKWSR